MTKNPEILYQGVPFFCCIDGFTAHLDKMTDLSEGNLVETARKLSKVRTHYKEWYKIAIPMLLIWVF